MDIAIKIVGIILKALWATAKFTYIGSCLVLGYGLLLLGAFAGGRAQAEDDEPMVAPSRAAAGIGLDGVGLCGEGGGTGLMESDGMY